MYIEKINGPEDVKKLTVDEMTVMAGEMREALLKRASIHGGHFGPSWRTPHPRTELAPPEK